MFNLFKKKPAELAKHRYKNLMIFLPAHWQYAAEGDGIEACFDPKSQSTLRLNIMKLNSPEGISEQENIKALTGGQSYTILANGYLLTDALYNESIQDNKNITIITWRLINYIKDTKIMAIITYTALSEEIKSTYERDMLKLVEGSLRSAELM